MSRTSERRAQRLDALRKKDQAGGTSALLQNRKIWIAGGAGVLVLIVIAAIAAAVMAGTAAQSAPATAAAATPNGDLVGKEVAVPNMGGTHIAVGQPHQAYNSIPPTSGPHFDTAAAWDTPADKTLPPEQWVHNLEHSGVVALYNCPQGCPDLLAKLEGFRRTGVRSKFGYVKLLVQPYDQLANKLTLVAWNFYLKLDDYDEAAVRAFFVAHQDKGPEPDTP
ncbi:MAG: DUF3105 domain-containing protein [Chloroflexi bacterium]|nr:DUF3105 domain-containing protein [Chloroflexota bacterium]